MISRSNCQRTIGQSYLRRVSLPFVCVALLAAIGPATPESAAVEPTGLSRTAMADRLGAQLRREGFSPWEDKEEHAKVADWLLHAGERAWDSIRNAAYEEVSYTTFSRDPAGHSLVRAAIHEVKVAFPPAGPTPPRFVAVTRFLHLRAEGYPRRGEMGETMPFMALKVFDGRRLLAGQFPGYFYRAANHQTPEGVRQEFHLINGEFFEENDATGRPAGFAGAPEGEDVFLVDALHEGDASYTRHLLADSRLAAAIHPLSPVLHSRSMLRHSTVPRMLQRDPLRAPNLSWWRREGDILLLCVEDMGSGPWAFHLTFDRETGLPVEYSTLAPEEGGWTGDSLWVEYASVLTEEGESLPLPRAVVSAGASVSPLFGAAFELGVDDIAGERSEVSRFFRYIQVNAVELDGPAPFSFAEAAGAIGLRIAPVRESADVSELDFPPDAVIYGPPANAPDYLEQWDEANRTALVRAGVPIPWHEVLPYAELMARRRPGGGMVYRSYWVDVEGVEQDLGPYGHVPSSDP